ncbi:hypothetical protein OHB36_19625 [Streptomyces sp. NBC_00320]|uniref:hypothetical protein n=1 Tax=Streptomyces sp. NBC_00320 TaxID=2975711 RepID=UPI00224F7CC8|nr:hypothetical protein [Streptomyces sp. NBC_00320]MCX5148957.1 hypothetical protein [Streptomyces sp. NBC_00320]
MTEVSRSRGSGIAAAFRRHHGRPPGPWREQQAERAALSEDGTGTAGDGVHFG